MSKSPLGRREVIAGAAGVAALVAARAIHAQAKPSEPGNTGPAAKPGKPPRKAIAPAAPPPPALAAIIQSTAECQSAGRYCLARCAEHLAAGLDMAACQRSVMNMLAVTTAMAEVAGYRNADTAQIKALASACAQFCRACAATCEPHQNHHSECKACLAACSACAKACEDYTA